MSTTSTAIRKRFVANPLAQAPEPPSSPPSMVMTVADVGELARARRLIKTSARALSALPPQAVDEFLITVSEVVDNGLTHGADPVHLTQWAELTALTCQVVDSGPGSLRPLTGYRYPDKGVLWACGWHDKLVDDLFISDAPEGGCSVLLTKT